MAFSLNRVQLLGNIGKDPETRFTTTNLSVTSFSVATQNSYKGKDGNWVNETTWHNIVAFQLSDFLKENLTKGKKIYLEGRIQTRNYEDKQGIKRYVTEIVADNTKIIPLDGGGSDGGQSYSNFSGAESNNNQQIDANVEDNNDDLPF